MKEKNPELGNDLLFLCLSIHNSLPCAVKNALLCDEMFYQMFIKRQLSNKFLVNLLKYILRHLYGVNHI